MPRPAKAREPKCNQTMRLACTIVFLALSSTVLSQEPKSLLWEISGNGLEQSSYLYGTMHVSKKIAFRLDDVFFEALDQSEIIALESDPGTWLDNEIQQGPDGYGLSYGFDPKGFYREGFLLEPPDITDLASYLAFDDRLINNILYRTNEYAQNFEEETYLDMFIYQAGAKFDKTIAALENLEESSTLVARASMNAMKNKPDEWLQKKMQGHDLNYLMQNAYRERNIDLLDSIDRAMYTDYYRKNMLYIRNEIMSENLDSVMHKGKVFAGIGAAHLPGSHGVIQLLRNKGYQVEPLVSEATEKGRKIKQKFEDQLRPTPLRRQAPEDGSFSLLLPNKLYPVSENKTTIYVSPDLANGSYLMVNRIPTYGFLKGSSISIEDVESLLFENIPGEIISKSRIEKNGYQGLDIVNQLKNSDFQRYQIYLKPLEILIFKMAGDGDFINLQSEKIFNSLEFKVDNFQPVELTSAYKDFNVEVPGSYIFYNPSRHGVRMIESHNPHNGSYYFLRRSSLFDLQQLEEDQFELGQIQKRFYQDLELEADYSEPGTRSLRSQAVFDHEEGKVLYLKTIISRADYYMLGVVTDQSEDAEKYFDSFSLKEETYPEEFKKIRDTAMLFTTVSPVSPKKFVEDSNGYFRRKTKVKSYNPYTKKTRYQNKNNEAITVELNKAHDLLAFPHIDSLWSIRKKQYIKKDFKIIREEVKTTADSIHSLQFIAIDTASTRGILVKNIVKEGVLFELKTLVDTLETPSKFISEFYTNFKPLDSLVGKNFIKDKSAEFFNALRSKDSIVLKGYRFPYYNESHIDSLEFYIAKFKYDNENRHIQPYLIQRLGELEGDEKWEFFNRFYKSCYGNSLAQVKILQALARQQNEASSKLLLRLMAYDLPLVSNTKEIKKIFKPYRDNLESAKMLFPELLEYHTVLEYKLEVVALLAELKSKNIIRSNTYKKYVDVMTTDARIQLKRNLGRQNSFHFQRSSQQISNKQNNQLLDDYAILLFPFRKQKDIQQFYLRLVQVKAPIIRTTYAALMVLEDEHSPLNFIDSLAGDINSRALLFDKLKAYNKIHLFPPLYYVQEALAESAIFEDRSFIASKDQVIYLGKDLLESTGNEYNAYFFKIRSKQDFDKNYQVHMVVYNADEEVTTEYFYKNDGYRMSDMDTDETAMDYVKEEFQLRDRSRAIVYRPEIKLSYSSLGF